MRALRSLLACLALLPLPSAGSAQTMPGPVYHDLTNDGHERLAREISKMLDLRGNPDRGDVEKLLSRWERDAGGPVSGYDWLAVTRLWLRADQAAEAKTALRRATGIPEGVYLLETARVAFLAGDLDAADAYWRACAVADETSSLEAWLDVEPLATPDEMEAWDRFRTLPAGDRDDCAFLRRFWNRRAAASGTEVNVRLARHYERYRYALEKFRRRGKEGPWLSSRLGRPRNSIFDDRGLLYVRMGPPDDVAVHGGDGCIEANVTWGYDRPGGYKLYHLTPLGGTDDWWLVSNLAAVYRCGSWDRNPFVAVSPLMVDIPPDAMSDLYKSRMGLDPAYARIAMRAATLGGADRLRVLEELKDESERTWADGEYAVATVPERPRVDLDVRLGLEWLQFRSGRPGHTRVWLNGIAESDELSPEELPDGRLLYRVDAVWTVLDESGDFYGRFPAEVRIERERELAEDSGLSIRISADLAPGSYSYLFSVSDFKDRFQEGPVSGGYARDTLEVRDLGGDLPILSDVAVAADSGGSWTPGGGVFLRPTPVHTTGADGVAHVYYEAYNLTPRGVYETRVRVEPKDGGEPFELTYPGSVRLGFRVATRGVLRLDLADTEPGVYRISVTVRDLTTGTTTLPTRTEIIVDRETLSRP